MRTTIEIPDQLLRQTKARAALRGMKLEEPLEAALYYPSGAPSASRLPHGAEDEANVLVLADNCVFPLIRGDCGPEMQDATGEQLNEILEKEEVQRAIGSRSPATEGRNAHVAATEDALYVTKIESNRIYRIDRAGTIEAFAGTGELGLADGPRSKRRSRVRTALPCHPMGERSTSTTSRAPREAPSPRTSSCAVSSFLSSSAPSARAPRTS